MDQGSPVITDADREQLNAYLDGELDASQSAEVERRLADDSEFRAEFEQLTALDVALDRLPSSTVGPAFAESTIEIVALTEGRAQTSASRRAPYVAAAVAGMLVACGLGYFAATRGVSYDEQLARDLPLIERLEGYEQLESVEFLRVLTERRVFSDQEPPRMRAPRERGEQ